MSDSIPGKANGFGMRANGYNSAHPVDAVRNERGRLEIQDGHHRAEAAKRAGIDSIPVNVWEN
jgi:filamentous hemagglutinin